MCYRRTPLNSLQEKGLLTVPALRQEFNRIVDKESALSSGERAMVRDIVWDALKRASMKMQVEEARKAEKSPVNDANIPDGTTAQAEGENAAEAK